MRDFRKDEKLAKGLISLRVSFIVQFLRTDHSIAEIVFTPIENSKDTQYVITHNVYVKSRGYVPKTLEDADLTKMKKLTKLRTERFPTSGGIVTSYLAVVLSSGYLVRSVEGRDNYGFI